TENMTMIILLIILSLHSLEASFLNESALQLQSDYFRNEFLQSASKIPNISKLGKCNRQLLYIFKNQHKLNVFPIIDSWGKIPVSLMRGNVYAVGNYEQCININTALPKLYGQLEGQYCRAMLPIFSLDQNATIQELSDGFNTKNDGLKLYLKSGICIPKACLAEDLEKTLPFQIRHCKVKGIEPLETIDYVTIGLMSFITLLLIIGTAYDYLFKGPNRSPYLLALSVPSNAEKLFHVNLEKRKSNIDCLNGIRVISMFWVIYGHTTMTNLKVPQINILDMLEWSKTVFSLFTSNATISVDSFFFLSGLLLSWVGIKEIEKSKGRLNVPLMYFHRYLRLTPMLGFVMLFVVSLLKFMGNGPVWDDFLEGAASNCKANWWMNLLYIENYATQKACLAQSWYLAIDFQLFLFSPIILYGFWRWGKKFLIVIAVLMALSVGCIYGTFYSKGFSGALIQNDSNNSERMMTYYKYTHTRYSIWLIGMSFGFLLYKSKDEDVKIPWFVQALGWFVTAGIIFGVTISAFYSSSNNRGSDRPFEGATYESFSKIGWGVMLSWVVFSCYHGYGGVVNSFLSNPIWQPLSRLCYAMYLSHITVMTVVNGNTQAEAYFSNLDIILKFWSHLGLTLMVSIVLVLAIESPLIGLEKMLFHRKSTPAVKEEQIDQITITVEEKSDL
ncbi:hypothetical protein ACFFRR_006463, partial [Megaselia abdita]